MQPAPIETSKTANSVDNPSNTLPTSQYGLSNVPESASGHLPHGSARDHTTSSEDVDVASVSSDGGHRGRRADAGRMSLQQTSSQESSPGSRIAEYERSHQYGRKRSGSITFQVVSTGQEKSAKGSVDAFPNEVLTHVLSHLPPDTLSAMSLVSKRFHKLITSPHAWRIAFARFFPGQESDGLPVLAEAQYGNGISDRRAFARLSALASWRSEYILRTKLLRSLARGRPALQSLSRGSNARHGTNTATAVITYGSGLLYPVSHIHATFGIGLNKKQPMLVHGAVEQGAASASDPISGKVGNWGLTDFEAFKHFADLYGGEVEYGLGSGDVVGMPNLMDISQPYGKVYGEACPGGRLFYTSTSEQRGRFLNITSSSAHELGVPEVNMIGCAVCSVWIAKSEGVLKVTSGMFGMLAGFSNGILASYALGVNPVHDRRFDKGEATAKWALSPGVPIIAICVDEKFTTRRHQHRRVWAVVLNALGEVFYLTNVPIRTDFKGRPNTNETDHLAWQTGKSVEWRLLECTRRIAKPDPFNDAAINGSYTPQSSSHAAGLSKEQLVAETKEIEQYLSMKPKHFQGTCQGWDMRRKLIVDFGGDDHHGAGENIVIINTGLRDNTTASIRRVFRRKTKTTRDFDLEPYPEIKSLAKRDSSFGRDEPTWSFDRNQAASPHSMPRSRTSSQDDSADATFETHWHQSNLSFGDLHAVQVTAVATDDSEFATLAAFEDPLLGMSSGSNASSPLASPLGQVAYASSASDIPGHRARYLAVGTVTGVVLLWDLRASVSSAADIINTVQPLRSIFTKSPQISSLALTSLYVVHGGNDGLVQAWDPLASSTEPIRTLNSRFSDRARRRIAQAEASIQGVGNNYYAAGAIVLDPDPTVLRGMVSLGTHLRYWSYSASAADAYKSRKRGKLRRRSERGSNSTANEQKYTHTGRGVLMDYIASEQQEMHREILAKEREQERLSGRYGTDLLGEGASEEDLLKYAMMVSEESYVSDKSKQIDEVTATASRSKQANNTPGDDDLEEAIRLSLLADEPHSPSPPVSSTEPTSEQFEIPVRYAKTPRHGTPLRVGGAGGSKAALSVQEQDEVDFALQLSLAEAQSRADSGHADQEEFPPLGGSASEENASGTSSGKGKGKRRQKGTKK